jgi:hypothetical protein
MPVKCSISSAFALLLYLSKFVRALQRCTEHFKTHCKISQYLIHRSTIDHHRHIVSGGSSVMLEAQLFLQPHLVPHSVSQLQQLFLRPRLVSSLTGNRVLINCYRQLRPDKMHVCLHVEWLLFCLMLTNLNLFGGF